MTSSPSLSPSVAPRKSFRNDPYHMDSNRVYLDRDASTASSSSSSPSSNNISVTTAVVAAAAAHHQGPSLSASSSPPSARRVCSDVAAASSTLSSLRVTPTQLKAVPAPTSPPSLSASCATDAMSSPDAPSQSNFSLPEAATSSNDSNISSHGNAHRSSVVPSFSSGSSAGNTSDDDDHHQVQQHQVQQQHQALDAHDDGDDDDRNEEFDVRDGPAVDDDEDQEEGQQTPSDATTPVYRSPVRAAVRTMQHLLQNVPYLFLDSVARATQQSQVRALGHDLSRVGGAVSAWSNRNCDINAVSANSNSTNMFGGPTSPDIKDVFVAQLPFDMPLSALQQLADLLVPGCVIIHAAPHMKKNRAYDGCAFLKMTSSDAQRFIDALHKRVLFDVDGVWVASTPAQQRELTEYCAFMQELRPEKRRTILLVPTPFSALTAEFALRAVRGTTPSPNSNMNGYPQHQQQYHQQQQQFSPYYQQKQQQQQHHHHQGFAYGDYNQQHQHQHQQTTGYQAFGTESYFYNQHQSPAPSMRAIPMPPALAPSFYDANVTQPAFFPGRY